MQSPRLRPRTAIADADLARSATVELPAIRHLQRPQTPRGLLRTVASFARPIAPERMIVVTLSPVFRSVPLLLRLRPSR